MTNAASDIWKDDRLGREEDALYAAAFLTQRLEERARAGQVRSYVLNVDAPWGAGKTFFLSRLREQLRAGGHPVAYVNAWRDDHASDPLLPVMAEIDDVLSPLLAKRSALKKVWEAAKTDGLGIAVRAGTAFGRALIKSKIGSSMDDLLQLDARTGQNPNDEAMHDGVGSAVEAAVDGLFEKAAKEQLADFARTRASIETFRRSVAGLLASLEEQPTVHPPLFILVDELDRCRPAYAIAMLERIKHLFSIDNVVFVVATDTTQLANSVCAIYGAQFDSTSYLRRFFDRRYSLPAPSMSTFIGDLLLRQPIDTQKIRLPDHLGLQDYVTQCLEWFRTNPRDIEQICDQLATVVTVWNRPLHLDICILLPLIVLSHFDEEPGPPETWARQAQELAVKRSGSRRAVPASKIELWNAQGKRQIVDPVFELTAVSGISGRKLAALFQMNQEDAPWHFMLQGLEVEARLAGRLRGSEDRFFIYDYPTMIALAGRLSR